MFFVERFFAVTLLVAIFDIIVNERRFVEAFDRGGNFADVLGQSGAGCLPQGLVGGDGEERPPAFAGPDQPIAPDFLGFPLGGPHDAGPALPA